MNFLLFVVLFLLFFRFFLSLSLGLSFLLFFFFFRLSLSFFFIFRFLFLRLLFFNDWIKLSQFSGGFLLEKGFHFLKFDGSRFISIEKVEEVTPVCLIHEDIAIFESFS